MSLNQLRFDLVERHASFIEEECALLRDFHRPFVVRINMPVRSAAGREFDIDALFKQGSGDDEDNQQHKCQVEQRRNIYLAQGH